jgi:hypothetical protein
MSKSRNKISSEGFFNQSSFHNTNLVLFASIEILEKSMDNKNQLIKNEENSKNKDFWTRMNPFKCGNYPN